MDLVANFDKAYDELLAQEDKMTPEAYDQAWVDFLNKKIDVKVANDCEKIIEERYKDQPELKKECQHLNDKFKNLNQTFKEYVNSSGITSEEYDQKWDDMLKSQNDIKLHFESFEKIFEKS